MKKIMILLILLILIGITVNAADITLNSSEEKIIIQKGNTTSTKITIKNNSSQEKQVFLRATTNNSLLGVRLTNQEITLNNNQSTELALEIQANNKIPLGEYEINVQAFYPDNQTSKKIILEVVEKSKYFETSPNKIELCINERAKTTIELKNISNTKKNTKIIPITQALSPLFNPNELTLLANEFKLIELELNANQEGKITIEFDVAFEKERERKAIEVNLIDCVKEPLKNIKIWFENPFIEMPINSSKEIKTIIQNDSNEKQKITLFYEGELNTSFSEKEIELEAEQEKTINLNIKSNQETGEKEVKIIALKQGKEISENTIKVRIMPEYKTKIDASSLEQEEIIIGKEKAFEIIISNESNIAQDYNITIDHNLQNSVIALTENKITLSGKESKKIILLISPDVNESIGEKEITIRIENQNIKEEKKVRFNIVDYTIDNMIKVLSYPEKIEMDFNSIKEITIKLQNELNEKIKVNAIIKALKANCNEIELNALEENELKCTIFNDNDENQLKEINSVIELRVEDQNIGLPLKAILNSKPNELIESKKETNNFLTGLVILTSITPWIILIAIIIIIINFVIIEGKGKKIDLNKIKKLIIKEEKTDKKPVLERIKETILKEKTIEEEKTRKFAFKQN